MLEIAGAVCFGSFAFCAVVCTCVVAWAFVTGVRDGRDA
jgi:hypothetical protein